MKATFLYSIIFMFTISTFQTYAMEASQALSLSQHRHYQALSKKNNPYKIQVLPDDAWDKIIAYSSHKMRANLKEVCTQLAHLTSINRLNKLIVHAFVIGNTVKEESAFFKALIKTSNPNLITPFVSYANKEAKRYCLNHILTEDDPTFHTPQQYSQGVYMQPLLKEALEQNNEVMIERIDKENIDENTINQYRANRTNRRMLYLLTIGGSSLLISLIGSGIGYGIWYYNYCTTLQNASWCDRSCSTIPLPCTWGLCDCLGNDTGYWMSCDNGPWVHCS